MSSPSTPEKTESWWQVGPMWLVVLGPVLVVVAGVVTLFIALREPDAVVSERVPRPGSEWRALEPQAVPMLPAMQARNHAATPKATPDTKP